VLGNRAAGTPAVVSPSTDGVLVRAAVRLAEQLFPGGEPWPDARGWLASGALPALPSDELQHPGVPGVPGQAGDRLMETAPAQ
jgi:hypothetical protein